MSKDNYFNDPFSIGMLPNFDSLDPLKKRPLPKDIKKSRKDMTEADHRADFSHRISNFHNQRCMKIWAVVMISLGFLPYNELHEKLVKSKEFRNDFRWRTRLLKGRLTTKATDRLITYLPHHPDTDSTSEISEHYIDAFTAFRVFQESDLVLPKEIKALAKAIENIPCPPDPYGESDETASTKEKPREAKEGELASKSRKRLHKLVIAMVKKHHGPLTEETLKVRVNEIVSSLAGSGLGRTAVRSQLEDALSGAP